MSSRYDIGSIGGITNSGGTLRSLLVVWLTSADSWFVNDVSVWFAVLRSRFLYESGCWFFGSFFGVLGDGGCSDFVVLVARQQIDIILQHCPQVHFTHAGSTDGQMALMQHSIIASAITIAVQNIIFM
jgi:hypothetical protein